jgi:hypothetical protein
MVVELQDRWFNCTTGMLYMGVPLHEALSCPHACVAVRCMRCGCLRLQRRDRRSSRGCLQQRCCLKSWVSLL